MHGALDSLSHIQVRSNQLLCCRRLELPHSRNPSRSADPARHADLDPPATHVQGPILLNVLRYTDPPEAAALLAPRPLKFYMRLPKASEYARHVYQL